MDDSLEKLAETLESKVQGLGDPTLRVRVTLNTLANLYQERRLTGFHRVLRELEFVDLELATKYYREVHGLLSRILREAEQPLPSPYSNAVALMIIGASQFIHLFRDIFRIPGDRRVDVEVAGDLILRGLGGEPPTPPETGVEALDIDALAEMYGVYQSVAEREVKRRLLKAALKLVSVKSFREVKVYEITSEAGYAVGMFYKVYDGKNRLLGDLVTILGKTLRRHLTECTLHARSPVERELLGTRCFLGFIERNMQIYRIVRESEFIDVEIAKLYYKPFAESYTARLSESGVKSYNHESLAIALMGVNHVAGVLGPMLHILEPREIIEALTSILPHGILALEQGETGRRNPSTP